MGGAVSDDLKPCILDATMGDRDEMFCFCPVEGDLDGGFSIVTGMNYISDKPPESYKFIAIVHEDGQDAAEAFMKKHKATIDQWSQP